MPLRQMCEMERSAQCRSVYPDVAGWNEVCDSEIGSGALESTALQIGPDMVARSVWPVDGVFFSATSQPRKKRTVMNSNQLKRYRAKLLELRDRLAEAVARMSETVRTDAMPLGEHGPPSTNCCRVPQ
jgi:hypothetical protein